MSNLYDMSLAILYDWGEEAWLCGDGWRKHFPRDPANGDLGVSIVDRWNGALAGGIDIERVEPLAYVATTDVDDYEFSNGWTLEVGDDTYRITAKSKGQDGMTVLTLAKT